MIFTIKYPHNASQSVMSQSVIIELDFDKETSPREIVMTEAQAKTLAKFIERDCHPHPDETHGMIHALKSIEDDVAHVKAFIQGAAIAVSRTEDKIRQLVHNLECDGK